MTVPAPRSSNSTPYDYDSNAGRQHQGGQGTIHHGHPAQENAFLQPDTVPQQSIEQRMVQHEHTPGSAGAAQPRRSGDRGMEHRLRAWFARRTQAGGSQRAPSEAGPSDPRPLAYPTYVAPPIHSGQQEQLTGAGQAGWDDEELRLATGQSLLTAQQELMKRDQEQQALTRAIGESLKTAQEQFAGDSALTDEDLLRLALDISAQMNPPNPGLTSRTPTSSSRDTRNAVDGGSPRPSLSSLDAEPLPDLPEIDGTPVRVPVHELEGTTPSHAYELDGDLPPPPPYESHDFGRYPNP